MIIYTLIKLKKYFNEYIYIHDESLRWEAGGHDQYAITLLSQGAGDVQAPMCSLTLDS